MNYETCKPMTECTCADMPSESMTDILKSTHCITADALNMARRINGHLFGAANSCCEKDREAPTCFRDELMETRCELNTLAEILAKMCSMLGV